MFVIQRILEVEGKLTLLDQNKVIKPHPSFRLFATTNTVGLGDVTGLYHGTQQINQGQMDRWHILSSLNYLDENQELKVVLSKVNEFDSNKNKEILKNMIKLANLTRGGFENGDISILMSPRTVISWAQNYKIFKDIIEQIYKDNYQSEFSYFLCGLDKNDSLCSIFNDFSKREVQGNISVSYTHLTLPTN